MQINFKLEGEYIELVKLLKLTDLCSTGGMAKNVISDGLVNVNGNIELRKRNKIKKGYKVEFDGNMIVVD